MSEETAGTVYLTDGDEPLLIPRSEAVVFEPNGWLTVERDGTSFHYPPWRIDHVERQQER